MRNLKRAMSLVLAAAMLIGMMVVSAGASYQDFTDKDEIVNTDAVSMLTELNVINGKEDGSYFDPTGIVTRAEMAKMITVVLNGGKDPVLGVKDKATFSDIKGTWAESYIEYCTSPSVGVISGRGNGKFDPTATVTAAEAAKMLLVSLGYDADVFVLTGANWQINTDVHANNAHLYDGLSITSSAPLTRDNAAQMIYNALNAFMMIKSYDKVLSNGEISYNYNLSTTKTLLSEKFGVSKIVGVLTSTENFGLNNTTSAKNYSNINVRTVNGATPAAGMIVASAGDKAFKVAADADLLGQEVALFVKMSNGQIAVVGNVVATANNKVVSSSAGLTIDGGLNPLSKFLKNNGLKLDTTSGAKTQVAINNGALSDATTALTNSVGNEIVFIDNDADGVVEYALTTTYTLTKVTAKSDKDETITLAVKGEQDYENCFGYEDLAKNDYVLYSLKNGKYTFTKPQVVTGKVSAYTDAKCFTVNGTVYYPSSASLETSALTKVNYTASNISGMGFSNTYDFYLDSFGYVVARKTAETVDSNDYAVVLASGASKSAMIDVGFTGQAKILMADGTVATYDVDMLASAKKYMAAGIDINGSATDPTTDAAKIAAFAQYIANSNNTGIYVAADSNKVADTIVKYVIADSKITLIPAADGANSQSISVDKSDVALGSTGKVLNSTTTFLYWDAATSKASAITGVKNISSSSKTVVAYVYDKDSSVVKFAYIKSDPGVTASNFAYVTSDVSVVTENDKTYNTYAAVLSDGTAVTLKIEDDSTVVGGGDTMTKNNVYAYTTNDKGIISSATVCSPNNNPLGTTNTVFTGYVESIKEEVVTVVKADGTKFSFDASDLSVVNITDTAKPVVGELAEGNQVTVFSHTPAGSANVVLGGAYVTKTTADTYAVTANGTVIGRYFAGQTVKVTLPTGATAGSIVYNDGSAKYLQSAGTESAPGTFGTGSVTTLTAGDHFFAMPAYAVTVTYTP